MGGLGAAERERPIRSPGTVRSMVSTLGQQRTGILFALLCAGGGAFVPAVAQVTTRAADPLVVTVLTTWFAAASALVVLALRKRLHHLFLTDRLVPLVLLGALGTCVAFALFFAGAARSTAIETVLCLQVEPLYALFLSWAALGVRPTVDRLAATAMIVFGLAIALGLKGLTLEGGTGYLLATPLCWQLSHLIALRWLPGTAPDVLAGARYLWGSLLLTVVAGWGGLSRFELPAEELFPWGWVILQGVVLSYGGTMLWYSALTRIDLARATVLVVPTVPLLSLLASFALVNEVPTTRQLLGVLLTATGVYLFARKPAPATPKHVYDPCATT